ncbi:hypothetical protein BpHYR1_039066 [Brachionus plicatilis]|uniref:Uncharacterized protein n=1 Tax=Brachionus plicatilis TaxID=10195 RepID=A0A3M7RBM6_BRAPC|nr:hypothetical protein BpHYR1_039066 [Brachionus plicatilis]
MLLALFSLSRVSLLFARARLASKSELLVFNPRFTTSAKSVIYQIEGKKNFQISAIIFLLLDYNILYYSPKTNKIIAKV